ncbi:hypothetical protein CAPTEDRAFT_154485 [Capitella teleta]|uniref:AH domain-containing protein n=1 Tax=Capitella teleta TaxID=283909 RepID=R7V646_CAPTE|nr:hypothetical protein CAPTEDRAFT_154485 [Capitella teleta]|eukprot:ELU14054.1 hypothetical protein CAPTEDRAFT_154485 [Capitella teleta]
MASGAPIPSSQNGPPPMTGEMDDETFERDLKEMLRDGPNLNDASANVMGGPLPGASSAAAPRPPVPSSLPTGTAPMPRSQTVPPATSNIPLSSPERNGGGFSGPQKSTGDSGLSPLSATKLDFLKAWSINTYKCTKQLISERFGKGSRTVDLELEAQIEALRDTQRKYSNVLRLARALTNHFHHVVQTQKSLGDTFSELSQKNPELGDEFSYNSETQKVLAKNGETLLGALNFFTSSVNTLCNKTMEDTLMTVKLYENARVEYDAYRADLDAWNQAPRDSTTIARLEDAQKKFSGHKEKFDRLRADVAIKLKFLDENKVKVMHKQLLLFHNAISAYFSGNQSSLEATLKQFNIKLKAPNTEKTSWLEQ